MLLLTILAIVGKVLSLNPIPDSLNIAFVYSPTSLLILVVLWMSLVKRRTNLRLR